jgi:hypothetical protein
MNNNLIKLNDGSSRILVNLDNVTEMEFKKKTVFNRICQREI